MQPLPSSPFRRRDSAAAYLTEKWGIPTSPLTLAKQACIGGGPAFRKAGRIPLYAEEDLDQYAREKIGPRVRTTSELPAPAEEFDRGSAVMAPRPRKPDRERKRKNAEAGRGVASKSKHRAEVTIAQS